MPLWDDCVQSYCKRILYREILLAVLALTDHEKLLSLTNEVQLNGDLDVH
jgi:hypothetical protein